MTRLILAIALLTPGIAQSQAPQFLRLHDTLEVEVHGLRTWTAKGLNDTLTRLSPGLSLASHACAGVMRRFLGFADAEVYFHKEPGQSVMRYAVTVVEPADSARVRRSPSPVSGRPMVERWRNVVGILRNEFQAMFDLNVATFLRGESDSTGIPPRLASPGSLRLRSEIRRFNTPQDLDTALAVYRGDSTSMHRIAALWILTNFPNDARAWGALLEGIRSERPMGYETNALAGMVPSLGSASVDLGPNEATLAAILGGTGVFQTIRTLDLLNRVSLDRSMARRLAVAGRDLLLSNLQSHLSERREAVRVFLERASGQQLGYDVEAWRRWLDR